MKFKIRNWKGDAIIKEKNEAVEMALFMGGAHLLDEANRIAPKDEGILIQTSDVDVDPDEGKAHVFYTQKYAPRLHENPQYNFQGGRQGKWLEKTIREQRKGVQQMMANELKKALN